MAGTNSGQARGEVCGPLWPKGSKLEEEGWGRLGKLLGRELQAQLWYCLLLSFVLAPEPHMNSCSFVAH